MACCARWPWPRWRARRTRPSPRSWAWRRSPSSGSWPAAGTSWKNVCNRDGNGARIGSMQTETLTPWERANVDPSQFRRIDAVCDDVEAALRGGERPRPDCGKYLARVPEGDRQRLLVELLRLESHYAAAASAETGPAEPAADSGAGPAPAPTEPSVPGYEILELLGKGGMGVVYKARQTNLKRVVALKMILAGEYAGSEHRTRFRREAESVARLRHPNIVQIYEVGDTGKEPFLTLEYVEGGSLAKKIAGAPQPPRQAAEFVRTLAQAVEAAHAQGVIHRDLKPANVLL